MSAIKLNEFLYFFESPSGSGRHQILACRCFICMLEMEFVENVFKYSVYVVSYLITVKQGLNLYLTSLILIS